MLEASILLMTIDALFLPHDLKHSMSVLTGLFVWFLLAHPSHPTSLWYRLSCDWIVNTLQKLCLFPLTKLLFSRNWSLTFLAVFYHSPLPLCNIYYNTHVHFVNNFFLWNASRGIICLFDITGPWAIQIMVYTIFLTTSINQFVPRLQWNIFA